MQFPTQRTHLTPFLTRDIHVLKMRKHKKVTLNSLKLCVQSVKIQSRNCPHILASAADWRFEGRSRLTGTVVPINYVKEN